jgi:hypothetical protein
MPAIWVRQAQRAHEPEQTIVAAAHVDRIRRQPDLDARRDDHARSAIKSARATAAMYVGDDPPSKRNLRGPRTSSSPGVATSALVDTRTGKSLGVAVLRGACFNVLDQYDRLFALSSRSLANSLMVWPLARHSSTKTLHSSRLRLCALRLRFMLRQDRQKRALGNLRTSDGYRAVSPPMYSSFLVLTQWSIWTA